jgi:hypothetical protein
MPPALVDDVESLPLNESAVLLTLAMRAAHAGHWALDLRTQEAYWSPEYATLIGVGPETPPSWDNWVAACIPPIGSARRRRCAPHRRASRDRRRVPDRASDGAVRWIAAKGQTYYAVDGDALRIIGVSFDVTEQKRAAESARVPTCDSARPRSRPRARADEVTALLDATPGGDLDRARSRVRVDHRQPRGLRGSAHARRLESLGVGPRRGRPGSRCVTTAWPSPRTTCRCSGAARGEEIRNYEEDVVFPGREPRAALRQCDAAPRRQWHGPRRDSARSST